MGIVNTMRSFFSNTRASIENPSTPINGDTLGALFQRGSAAGVAVDEYSIIGLPAFYRATQILGGVVASIPFDIIEKLDNGGTRIATEHPNYKIISRDPTILKGYYNGPDNLEKIIRISRYDDQISKKFLKEIRKIDSSLKIKNYLGEKSNITLAEIIKKLEQSKSPIDKLFYLTNLQKELQIQEKLIKNILYKIIFISL
jgi:hypothetical protein